MSRFTLICAGLTALCCVMWGCTADNMCLKSEDCAPDGCCTIANMPYPTPTCNPYRQEGDTCKPNHKPFNSTTHTPDGAFWYSTTGVYSNLCPCAPGLICKGGYCKKQ